MTVTVIEFLK